MPFSSRQGRQLTHTSSCSGVAGFWAQMSSSADLMAATPPDRWDADAYYAQPGAKTGIYARQGAYCAGVQEWDAAFYKLPANEALAMDPNTRALLDLSQAALLRPLAVLSRARFGLLICAWRAV
jgi:acyl transferase domain-containing protein